MREIAGLLGNPMQLLGPHVVRDRIFEIQVYYYFIWLVVDTKNYFFSVLIKIINSTKQKQKICWLSW